jgi:predicted transporter
MAVSTTWYVVFSFVASISVFIDFCYRQRKVLCYPDAVGFPVNLCELVFLMYAVLVRSSFDRFFIGLCCSVEVSL